MWFRQKHLDYQFIDYATKGKAGGIGDSLDACTKNVRMFRISLESEDLRSIVLVDTPGLDTNKTEGEVVAAIVESLASRKFKVDAILYIQRITDNRLTGMPLKSIRLFSELLTNVGETPDLKVITTMWKNVEMTTGETRERLLRTDFKFGGKVCQVERFGDSTTSALDIIKNALTPTGDFPGQSELKRARRASAPASPVDPHGFEDREAAFFIAQLRNYVKEQKEEDRKKKHSLWKQLEPLLLRSKATKIGKKIEGIVGGRAKPVVRTVNSTEKSAYGDAD
ncbi:hypothetical protein FRC17_004003 [Serendipita sp. 399]|nr:hypothetical protein FRC17_004003 [Serendipita sp. 399]